MAANDAVDASSGEVQSNASTGLERGPVAQLGDHGSGPQGRRPSIPRTSQLQRVLDEAAQLGFTSREAREDELGELRVDVKEDRGGRTKKLVRNLLEMGFKHEVGKGYWR